jgi:uncharacterized protein
VTRTTDPALLAAEDRLLARLRTLDGAVVAFSGGVDSSYLLWAAVAALGPARVRAVLGVSASVPAAQVAQAGRVAAMVGADLARLATSELEDERYRTNAGDRCYACKDTLFAAIAAAGVPPGWTIVDGTNDDDLGGHRPGRRAAGEHGVASPLAESGLGKEAIRLLSRAAGLPTADLPASPCLASRFPAGVPVTAEGLARVEAAEEALKALGFRELRVRHHGDLARIELGAAEQGRALDAGVRATIARRLRELGYRFVSLDLEPYASGRGATLP